METRDIEYLLAIEKSGGVGKAAEALGMSQPALTKAIQRIESQVGVTLFERTGNGVVATPAGTRFLQRARRITLEYEDTLKEMRAMKSGEVGMLRLGYSPTVPSALVFGTCQQLMRDRPAARIRLRQHLAEDLCRLLSAGELDLMIGPVPQGEAGSFMTTSLFRDRLAVIADEAHPLHQKRNVQLADLAEQAWLLPMNNIALRRQIDAVFRHHGLVAPEPRIEFDFGSHSLVQLIRGTLVICVASQEVVTGESGLKAIEWDTKTLDLSRNIGVSARFGGYLSPLAERMIELLIERSA